MNARTLLVLCLLPLIACAKKYPPAPVVITPVTPAAPVAPAIVYPVSAKGTVTDTYFGTTVADPYRWLEDPDAPDARTWIDAQNKLTRSWLDAVPERARSSRAS